MVTELQVLAKCCPKLKRLDFPGSGWYKAMLTDSLPSGLGSGIPSAEALTGLRQLKLSRIKFKEDSTLQSMLSRLPQLKVLELENVYSDENVEELRIVSASVETIHLIDDGSFEILEIGAPELRAFIISSAERTDETGSWYSTGAELRFLEVMGFTSTGACFEETPLLWSFHSCSGLSEGLTVHVCCCF